MSTITRAYSYTAGNTIDPDENNANENALYNLVNGNLDNDNIKSGAGITESKIGFNTSTGHNHDGVNSKAIPKGFVWTINGTLTTGDGQGIPLTVIADQTINKAWLNVHTTAPTGAAIIVDIEKSTDGGANWTSIWQTNTANRVSIAAGSRTGTQTSFDTTSLSAGNLVRANIDQVGSSVSGVGLTITLS